MSERKDGNRGQRRKSYVGLRGVSYGPIVHHMSTHLGVLGESGIILDESERLVLELDDENSFERVRSHTECLVAIVGVILLDRKSGLRESKAREDSKHSLHD